jgi:acetylornithine deacetylase
MIDFLMDILEFDSTSGKENELAEYIFKSYKPDGAESEIHRTEGERLNVFFRYGYPKVIFCSHLDTVPPYIPANIDGNFIYGRGSCDAKGQIAFLFEVFKQLKSEGYNDIGMLMTSGEEDGSQGAIKANELIKGCDYIFIGEPTQNKLIKAAKGNLLFKAIFKGKSCHSGYPESGDSAVMRMNEFINKLGEIKLPEDKILGKTTFNIGKVKSMNAHNVLSDNAECKIFFRTTFSTDNMLKDKINEIKDDMTEIEYLYGDKPMNYYTVEGFGTGIVSYGSDAPAFTNIKNKILYGPGNIIDAHTENEFIKTDDLYKAVNDVKIIYKKIINEN